MLEVEDKTPLPTPDGPETETPAFRDEEGEINPEFLAAAADAIEASEVERLQKLVEDFHESELGDLLEALEPDQRPRLIELLGTSTSTSPPSPRWTRRSARRFSRSSRPPPSRRACATSIPTTRSPSSRAFRRRRTRRKSSTSCPPSSASRSSAPSTTRKTAPGGACRPSSSPCPPFWTVGQTIDFMRETEDLPETFYEIFVIDPAGHLLGSVPLDRLLRSKRPVTIQDVMNAEPDRVEATEQQDEVARLFERYNLVSAAVVDDAGRLVGVMIVDDIVDVLEEEADADIKQLGGVKSDEELSDTVLYTQRSRFPWLFANMCTAFLAASVIRLFSESLERMVALAILMPIVASMGGNAGTQTMTVAVRALATRELGRANAWRIIRREAAVGLLNGLVFAVILGTLAGLWFQSPQLGIVIGLALITVLVFAALGGIFVPLTLNRFGVDPAVSSGPFVTSITDIVGFFAFLGIATAWFQL